MSSDTDKDQERGLERAITTLREEVPVRDEWREALDRELMQITAPPVVHRFKGGWQFTPITALAAAIAFMIIGASINDLIRRNIEPTGSIASTDTRNGGTSAIPTSSSAIGVRFSVMARGVNRVSLVGDFNGWNADATPLQLAGDGQTWTTMLPLAAGRHAYAFVIDGHVVRDPAAPQAPEDDFGVPNSLVLVSNNR